MVSSLGINERSPEKADHEQENTQCNEGKVLNHTDSTNNATLRASEYWFIFFHLQPINWSLNSCIPDMDSFLA
jgi:hypothetical protein